MYKSTITVKGQTTIPLDIRKKLNLSAGDNIEYYTNDNNTVTIFNSNLDIHNLCGILPKPSKAITIEEMKEVINNSPYAKTLFLRKFISSFIEAILAATNNLYLMAK